MPILRYFVFVGGALLALLFAVDQLLPSEPVTQSVAAISNEQPMIRIRSDRHLPERVVFDTSQPTVKTPIVVAATKPQTSIVADITDIPANARIRDAHAEIAPAVVEAAAVAKADSRAKPQTTQTTPKRKVAKLYHNERPVMRVAQQPHFGLFDTTW